MSFSLKVYAIEIKSIAALYASNKLELADKIIKKYADEIEDINDWTEAEISAEKALYEIFEANCSSTNGEIYALVIELICKEMGEELPNDEWNELSMNWIMDINLEASLPIMSLPIPADYPYVLTISNKAADEFITNFRLLDYETRAMQEAELWIQKLVHDKKDLMLFFY
jgi:hypothetical protein